MKQTQKEWEKELREKTWLKPMGIDELVEFISSLLVQQREELIKEIEETLMARRL